MSDKTTDLKDLAQRQADRWRINPYYDNAETRMATQWKNAIFPFIEGVDFAVTVDLAAGHGRNSECLLPFCEKLYIVDVNNENIDYCKNRFSGRDDNIEYIVNDGTSISQIESGSISFLYCFDAMVHFDSDVVRSYLREAQRILKPGGYGFCHHSNSTADPGGADLKRHVRGRNFMTKELFEHYCAKEGLKVQKSRVVDWAGEPALDCFSLFLKA